MAAKKLVCSLKLVPMVDEIIALRSTLNLSQAEFAELLGVSRHTVQSWELKRNPPSLASTKTLNMLKSHPDILLPLLRAA